MNPFDEKIRIWISDSIDLSKNFEFEQFKVGRSNLTFKICDKKNTYVLRRPPLGSKLESAHDMKREYRIISNLYKCKYRVPKPYVLCDNRDISSEDFYIMEYINGQTIIVDGGATA